MDGLAPVLSGKVFALLESTKTTGIPDRLLNLNEMLVAMLSPLSRMWRGAISFTARPRHGRAERRRSGRHSRLRILADVDRIPKFEPRSHKDASSFTFQEWLVVLATIQYDEPAFRANSVTVLLGNYYR